jgi:hypothetical protein
LPDWIGSHTRAFGFYGGVPAMVVSDNLKSGITKACFYEPPSIVPMPNGVHYDTAIVPARPRKPRDKAKVEVARSRRAGLSQSCAESGSSLILPTPTRGAPLPLECVATSEMTLHHFQITRDISVDLSAISEMNTLRRHVT